MPLTDLLNTEFFLKILTLLLYKKNSAKFWPDSLRFYTNSHWYFIKIYLCILKKILSDKLIKWLFTGFSLALHRLTGSLAHWLFTGTEFLSRDFCYWISCSMDCCHWIFVSLDFWLSGSDSALPFPLPICTFSLCLWLQSKITLLWHPKLNLSFSIGLHIVVIIDVFSGKPMIVCPIFLPCSIKKNPVALYPHWLKLNLV